ncbi:hypothetical protein Oter_2531 [Opitutus terrae PB90-1]|uniref:Uncharacterized protein n=2 Tax=Opitutus terrae TaxID=107709 RepID=B1ZT24_OPITP|nr:hypothetical protein Oter_2531 [Opitutus terrae PB90-1]
MRGWAVALTVVGASSADLLFLLVGRQLPWAPIVQYVVVPLAGIIYSLALWWLLSCQTTVSRKERRENAELTFKFAECTVLIVGVVFAVHAARTGLASLQLSAESNRNAAVSMRLTANSNQTAAAALMHSAASNRTAARAQLYEGDNAITQAEAIGSDTKLQAIYAMPNPHCATDEEARAYISRMLGMVTDDPMICGVHDAAELYERTFGHSSYTGPTQPERSDIAQLRRMLLHCTLILNLLHSAHDDVPEGIIEYSEYETWAGYFNDIGPHPVLLETLWLWDKRKYMSKEFAHEVHDRLYVRGTDAEKRIIRLFLPELAIDTFGQELPGAYAKRLSTISATTP